MHEGSVADARKEIEEELVWQTMDYILDSFGQLAYLELTVEVSILLGSAQENCSPM